MEAVAADDEVAVDDLVPSVMAEADRRRGRLEIVEGDVLDLVAQVAASFLPHGDQILDHLVLAVDHDRAARQLPEIDAMAAAAEADLDPVVDEPFRIDPGAEPDRAQEVDDALLEDAGAHAGDHVLLRPVLEDDRLDALEVEQVREQQARRPCADDSDLRPARHPLSSSTTRCAIANALFAAGTPQ